MKWKIMFFCPPTYKSRLRFYTWLTLVTVTASFMDFPFQTGEVHAAAVLSSPLTALANDVFPAQSGTIEKIHDAGTGRPQVMIIQDAHAVTEAQRHIQNLIRYFEDNAGVRLVAVEGAEGTLDPLLLRTFPDSFVKEKVLQSYLESGELTGAEMAAVVSPVRSSYEGLEDWQIYESNHRAYHLARASQAGALQALNEAYKEWARQARVSFSPELLSLHEKREMFYRDEMPLAELLANIKSYLARLPSGFEKEISGLKSLIGSLTEDQNSHARNEEMQADITKMAALLGEKINHTAGQEEATAFNVSCQAFLTGQTDAAAYLGELIRFGARNGLEPRMTSAMKLALARSETLSVLKGGEIFRELEKLFEALELVLGPEKKNREILKKFDQIRRLRDLARLELTRDSFEGYRENAQGHLSVVPDARTSFEAALEFYEIALERDQVFFRNLEGFLKKRKLTSAVVVAGGFHARGLEQSLKDAGYSYAVISPGIASLKGHEVYDLRMKGEVSYRGYLETTYYDAFARHAGIRLMEQVSEPDFKRNLRVWRDEVIRELARAGEISKVGNYTRYIDLLFNVYQKRFQGNGKAAYTPEALEQALSSEIHRIRIETENTWSDSFRTALKSFTGSLGLKSDVSGMRPPAVIPENVKAQTLSAHLALASNQVFSWHKPGGALPSRPPGIDPALVPFSTGDVMTDALTELAREAEPETPSAIADTAARTAVQLASVARQAEKAAARPEAPLVRDVGTAREGLRRALDGLPGEPPEMAREILDRGGNLLRSPASGTFTVPAEDNETVSYSGARVPEADLQAAGSARSEMRQAESLSFDEKINQLFMELQWVWYGTGEDGVPHEDNLYRQISQAREQHFTTPDSQFDPDVIEAYNASLYRILDESYNNRIARSILEEITSLTGVDYRIFFFHGSIFEAFRAVMDSGRRKQSPALDYADDMPSTPGFFRYDAYDLEDFHQVFVELVQNNQRHMKPNNMIVAVKRETGDNVDLVYYYGNLNTDDAANIEQSLYGGEYANDYGGNRQHAFFNVVAPAIFRIGGTIRVEFSGKAWEFYPRNWANWRWLRAMPALWTWAWYTAGKWFFRSGAGRQDLGPSNLVRGHGVKVTLSMPRHKLKKLSHIPRAPVDVEFARVRVPGSIQDVLVYSGFDEDENAVKVHVTTEEMRGPRLTAVTADLTFPGKPADVTPLHEKVVDTLRNDPANSIEALAQIAPNVVYKDGKSFDLSEVRMNDRLLLHLLKRFIPGLDLGTVIVEGEGDTFTLKIPAAAPDAEARLDAFRDHIRSTFVYYDALLEKPSWLGNGFRLTVLPGEESALQARSEMREARPQPPLILIDKGGQEGRWTRISQQLQLEKWTTGGSTKVYITPRFPDFVLKKKEIPLIENLRIEAPWNSADDYIEISEELEALGLGVSEKPLYIRKDDTEASARTNLTWQAKGVSVLSLYHANPENASALTGAMKTMLERMWKKGYFDADFKFGNFIRYETGNKTTLRLLDFDFVYRIPETDDPEVLYQWLRNRDLTGDRRLHLSPSEHFLVNMFYYEDMEEGHSGYDQNQKAKDEVQRMAPISKALFPTFDPEKVRSILSRVFDAGAPVFKTMSPGEKQDPPLEKVRLVKQALLDGIDKQRLFETASRILAEKILEQRRSEMREPREKLADFLSAEEIDGLDRRVETLRETYRNVPLSLQARAMMLYPTILLVLLGQKPAQIRYNGQGVSPEPVVRELEAGGKLPEDLRWDKDAGLFYDIPRAARRLISPESRLLRESGILMESDRTALDEIARALAAGDSALLRAETPALVDVLLARTRAIPVQHTRLVTEDALYGLLLGYPEAAIRASIDWRLNRIPKSQMFVPETAYPGIEIVSSYDSDSFEQAHRYRDRTDAVLDYTYSRFESEDNFLKIAAALQLPQARSELRPEADQPPDELGLPPRDWLERLFRVRLFWEGEHAPHFREMKALIHEYRDVRGMRSMISRLASSFLSGDRASFNEVAGELFIMKRLIDHLAAEYEIEVLGLGLNAGFREIDGFIKLTPRPGAALAGTPLEAGLYIFEAKEDGAADLRSLITNTIRDQVGPQIENARFLAAAGLPLRGAIVGVGGENSRLAPAAGLQLETPPEGASIPVYSFTTNAFSIRNSPSPQGVAAPAEDQLRTWNQQHLNIETFFYRTLLPAFGLPAVVTGTAETERRAALHELERRERNQRGVARRNIVRKKRDREARARELERRAREVEGWEYSFEGLTDPDVTAGSNLVAAALRWYFGRPQTLEILRRQIHDAARDPALPQEPAARAPDYSDLGDVPDVEQEGDIRIAALSPTSPENRDRAWAWLKSLYQASLTPPVRAPGQRVQPGQRQRPAQPRAPRPQVDLAAREATGWVGSFVNHPDVDPLLTDADIPYVQNILWIYFQGRIDRGQPVGTATGSRQTLQAVFADLGRNGAWEWVQAQAEEIYGGPVDRSEMRAGGEAGSGAPDKGVAKQTLDLTEIVQGIAAGFGPEEQDRLELAGWNTPMFVNAGEKSEQTTIQLIGALTRFLRDSLEKDGRIRFEARQTQNMTILTIRSTEEEGLGWIWDDDGKAEEAKKMLMLSGAFIDYATRDLSLYSTWKSSLEIRFPFSPAIRMKQWETDGRITELNSTGEEPGSTRNAKTSTIDMYTFDNFIPLDPFLAAKPSLDIMIVGPYRNLRDIRGFINHYPRTRRVHLVDVDAAAFMLLESALEADPIPGVEFIGYRTSVTALPEELTGKMDLVFDKYVFSEAWFSANQHRRSGDEIMRVLKPGAIHASAGSADQFPGYEPDRNVFYLHTGTEPRIFVKAGLGTYVRGKVSVSDPVFSVKLQLNPYYPMFAEAPPEPPEVPLADGKTIEKLLAAAGLAKNETLIDLRIADGRVLKAAALAGASVVKGYDPDKSQVFKNLEYWSSQANRPPDLQSASIYHDYRNGSYSSEKFQDWDVVYIDEGVTQVFIGPEEKPHRDFLEQISLMKPGARLIVHRAEKLTPDILPGFELIKTLDFEPSRPSFIYRARSELRSGEEPEFSAESFDAQTYFMGQHYFGEELLVREFPLEDYNVEERGARDRLLRFELSAPGAGFKTTVRLERNGGDITSLQSPGVPKSAALETSDVEKRLLTWDLILGLMQWLSDQDYGTIHFRLIEGGPGLAIFVGTPSTPGIIRAGLPFWKNAADGEPRFSFENKSGAARAGLDSAAAGDSIRFNLAGASAEIAALRQELGKQMGRELRQRAGRMWRSAAKRNVEQALAQFDAVYGRSELRTTDEPPAQDADARVLGRWLQGWDESRIARDLEAAGNAGDAARNIWEPEGTAAITRRAERLEGSLREVVLSDAAKSFGENNGTGFNEIALDLPGLQRAIGEDAAADVDAYGMRDRLIGRVSALAEGRTGETEKAAAWSAPDTIIDRAKWLLAPRNREILRLALLERFGQEISLAEKRRMVMDLSFFEGTSLPAADKFVRARVSDGGLLLAYLKSTETNASLTQVFRLPGVEKKQYTLEEGLVLDGEEARAAVYMLASGTPVQAKNVKREQGVFVGKQVYFGSRLDAPEFAVLVQMALEVEALRRQLEDLPGAHFPEFTQATLKSAFGLLEDLLETEVARQAFAASA